MLKLGKKNIFWLIFWILFYFLVFGLLLRNSYKYLDPDFGWHLKVGEEISQTRSLPHLNNYNYSFTGNWVDHEWLTNLGIFKIYNYFGYQGVNIFFALVLVLALVVLNFFTHRFAPRAPNWLIASLQLFGVIACLPHFGVRVQEFSFLFLILELFIITEFESRRAWWILIFLIPLLYFWANMHGGFVLGLALLFFFLGIKFFERLLFFSHWRKYVASSRIFGLKELKIFFSFFLITVLITFITPYGLELYSFLGGYGNTFYLKVIQEWLPQYYFPFFYWQMAYLVLIILSLVYYFYEFRRRRILHIDFWQVSLLILFFVLSFKSRRHFPLLFVVSFLFLVENLAQAFAFKRIKNIAFGKELKALVLICLVLVGSLQYINLRPIGDPFNYFCAKYPCRALNFLKTNKQYQELNIFNDYNWGGYLIWMYPTKKLFIDGRLPQVEFVGHTFLEEYYEFYKEKSDYAAKLDQYNIRLVLLKTADYRTEAKKWEKFLYFINDETLISKNHLRRYLEGATNWQKIYSDPLASIYLKIN